MGGSKTKKMEQQQTANSQVLAKAAGINLDSTLAGIGATQTKVVGILAQVQEALITKHGELAAVDEAIALKQAALTELHGKDQALLTLDEVKVQHAQFIAQRDEDRRTILAREDRLKADLEQTRYREESEHVYARELHRKQAEDVWQAQVDDRTRAEMLRTQALERGFEVRASELLAREVTAKAAVDKEMTFEARVDAEVKRQVSIAKAISTREHEVTINLMNVQHASALSDLQKDVGHLRATNLGKEVEIVELKTALAASTAAQTALARAAVDAGTQAKAQGDAIALMTNLGQTGGNGARPRG